MKAPTISPNCQTARDCIKKTFKKKKKKHLPQKKTNSTNSRRLAPTPDPGPALKLGNPSRDRCGGGGGSQGSRARGSLKPGCRWGRKLQRTWVEKETVVGYRGKMFPFTQNRSCLTVLFTSCRLHKRFHDVSRFHTELFFSLWAQTMESFKNWSSVLASFTSFTRSRYLNISNLHILVDGFKLFQKYL